MEFCDRGGSEVVQRFMAGRGGRGDSEQMRDFSLVSVVQILCVFCTNRSRMRARRLPNRPRRLPNRPRRLQNLPRIVPGENSSRNVQKSSAIFRNSQKFAETKTGSVRKGSILMAKKTHRSEFFLCIEDFPVFL